MHHPKAIVFRREIWTAPWSCIDLSLCTDFKRSDSLTWSSLTNACHSRPMVMTFQAYADKQPTSFIIPDLVSHCAFSLSYNVHGDEVARQSMDWLDGNCSDLNAEQRRALRGLQAGELTAYCYTTTSPQRLRVVSDFMNYLFHLYIFFNQNIITCSFLFSCSSQGQYQWRYDVPSDRRPCGCRHERALVHRQVYAH